MGRAAICWQLGWARGLRLTGLTLLTGTSGPSAAEEADWHVVRTPRAYDHSEHRVRNSRQPRPCLWQTAEGKRADEMCPPRPNGLAYRP